MKVAIVSDLHLNHWSPFEDNIGFRHPMDVIKESFEQEKPDVILDAGDYEKDYVIVGIPTFKIQGNHDYYGTQWQDDNWLSAIKSIEVDGVKIGMTTLWSDFNGHKKELMYIYEAYLADCQYIRGFSAQKAYEAHCMQKEWLYKNAPFDIIVTHNTPSFRSVHPRYLMEDWSRKASYGFSSHLDEMVTDLDPKLWIHGHTHDPFDYMLGNTRIICNPLGYPGERQKSWYQPVYVEL